MHDQAHQLESRSGEPCGPTGRRQAERPDTCGPVASSGAQHGAGMADSAEPPACNGESPTGATADVAGVCSTGHGSRADKSHPRPAERLASLGDAAGERRQPLHPETQSSAVTPEKPMGPVSTENVLRLLDYQECRCALTGRPLTPDLASLDHITPIRVGGEHAIENTQVLHRDVNRAKGSLTNDEFLHLCSEVVTHAFGPSTTSIPSTGETYV